MITEHQAEFFQQEGYLMVPDVFDPADFIALRREFTEVIHQTAIGLRTSGKLSRLYEEEPFERRLSCIFSETDEILGPLANGNHSGPALFEIITHPRMIRLIESFIGPEIIASSVYRVRPKIPGMARGVVPWHQDSAYFSTHCDQSLIITCWIPLVDATVENGCLEVLPRAHHGQVVRHYTDGPNGYLVIDGSDLPRTEKPVAVPVPVGGVLLLTNRTPHCSTSNNSDVVRWSIDLRYQDAETPNNVGESPREFSYERPGTEIACYPPEADFVVQSVRHPESAVRSAAKFDRIRKSYERSPPPSPLVFQNRDWISHDMRAN